MRRRTIVPNLRPSPFRNLRSVAFGSGGVRPTPCRLGRTLNCLEYDQVLWPPSTALTPRTRHHPPVRILGIDLAAQPASMGVVILETAATRWHVVEPDGPADDDRLVELARGCDVIGLDAPLGWPIGFVEAVLAHRDGLP